MSKTILITGASTGIGAATAKHLASGNHVLVHYNSSFSAAEEVAASVEEAGGKASLFEANLMEESGCVSLHEQVAKKCDRLDALVNNAGSLIARHKVEDLEWSLIEQIFRLNTFAPMLLTRLFRPMLQAGSSPCVVNVTSVAMRSGAPNATVYAASKGAMDTFTRGSARELAPHIRVNAVAPGVILTPFHDRFSNQEHLDMLESQTPVQDHGTADQIATAIELLITNTFITGETLDVNGGLFMR